MARAVAEETTRKRKDFTENDTLWLPDDHCKRLTELTNHNRHIKEKPLRRDVCALGTLPGMVLKEQRGQAFFDEVEKIRLLMIQQRESHAQQRDARESQALSKRLSALIGGIAAVEAHQLTKALPSISSLPIWRKPTIVSAAAPRACLSLPFYNPVLSVAFCNAWSQLALAVRRRSTYSSISKSPQCLLHIPLRSPDARCSLCSAASRAHSTHDPYRRYLTFVQQRLFATRATPPSAGACENAEQFAADLGGESAWPSLQPAFFEGFHHSLPVLAEAGNNLIVEHIVETEAWMARLVRLLAPFDEFFMGIHCPLSELERRERARGDRRIGEAYDDQRKIYSFSVYDLELDAMESLELNARTLLAA